MVQPVMPVIDYILNQDYYAEELCENKSKPELACNGKCHLQKELQKITKHQSQENQKNLPALELEKYPVEILYNPPSFTHNNLPETTQNNIEYTFSCKEFQNAPPGQPPKTCC